MYLRQKAFLFAVASVAFSQTTMVDLRTQGKAIDFTSATATRPAKSGTALPAGCQVAELFFKTDAPAGSNLFACTATNTWTLQAGGGGGGAVSSVFGRAGAVSAATGDYTAAQVTNAVDSTGSYSNPGWLASLAATKLTGVAPVANGGTGTATPALIGGANVTITGNWPNQTINSTASGSGGGGSSAPTNFPVSQSGTTTLSIGAGCSSSAPCNVRFGNTVYSFQNSVSASLTSGAGIAFIYISSSGILTIGHNLSLTCSAGCVAQAGVSGFPTGSIPLYSWSSTAGAWDASGGIDYRASLSSKNFICGTGLICSESGGSTTAVLDPTAIPAGGGSTSGGSATNFNGVAGMTASTCTLTGYCSDSSGRVSLNLIRPVVYYFHLAAPLTFNAIGFQIASACTNCALRIAVLKASDLSVVFDTGAMSDALVAGADLTTAGLKKSPSTLTTLAAGDYALTWATNSSTLAWYVGTSGSYYIRNPFWASFTLTLGTAGVFSGSTTGSGASFAFPVSFGTISADPDEMVPAFLFIR